MKKKKLTKQHIIHRFVHFTSSLPGASLPHYCYNSFYFNNLSIRHITIFFLFFALFLFLFHFSQSKCSMFRGVILCLCLNLTYANVVRFPRELDRHGTAFLLPFLVIFLFVGLPIILLEIALGQFLGQGSAHSWRASPIFRGASIVGRLASWLGAISISLQGVLGMVYTGEILLKSVPFNHCEVSVSSNI